MAAHTSTQPIRTSTHLAKKGDEINTAHDKGRGTTMIECQRITILKLTDDSGGDSFLPHAQVHFTRNVSLFPEFHNCFFKPPRKKHLVIKMPFIHLFCPVFH